MPISYQYTYIHTHNTPKFEFRRSNSFLLEEKSKSKSNLFRTLELKHLRPKRTSPPTYELIKMKIKMKMKMKMKNQNITEGREIYRIKEFPQRDPRCYVVALRYNNEGF